MPKKKVAVALSDWLLEELDDAAELAGTSRSALVEKAVASYVASRRSHEQEKRFRKQARLAMEDMQRYADEYHADPAAALEPSSLEKLRAIRAEGRGVPQ